MESSNVSASPTGTDGKLKKVEGKKREVTPEQEAMKKRRKVANDVETTNGSNENYKVCQFVVQNLKAGRGHANSNYSVSLLVGKHGLFDLVLKVFEILRQKNLTDDSHFSHLWSIVFDGTKYHNGWRGSGFSDGPKSHIDDQDIRPLQNLGLKKGQKGKFEGESASFDFVVMKINDVPEQDAQYPKYSAIQTSFSSALSDDWISGAQITACLRARDDWQDYFNGDENSSKRERRTFKIVPCKPLPPQWTPSELELLGLLMNAGHKFAKSWKNILQYALVNRPKAATSGQWYKLQKEAYRREYFGRGKTNAAKTLLAKKLAKSCVENIPTPPTQAEILAERNKMIERRQRLRMGFDASDSDSDDDSY